MWRALPDLLVALLTIVVLGETVKAQDVSFQRDVLPLLSDRCFQCHGPDKNARKSGLRLDVEEAVLGGTDPIVRAHQSHLSELVARISSNDPEHRMPPEDSNLSLTPEEIATIIRWIDQGARWDQHWAFIPPKMPVAANVANDAWPENPIDHFVLARLEAEGLAPSEPATKAMLLRRVTLDLTGLPPTLEELDAFEADTTPDAYERVVDRLLDSPRYGERMAWEWLEAARYADTDGFQADPTRSMWPWRDWLIDALNDNLPFDEFTIEAIAGDLVPSATQEQIVASGFNRNHMYNGEGGRIAEETRVENVFDRTETTATTWLGLTMNCARCHDHKFDPISQREYYQLFDFFNQTSESGAGGQGKAPPTLRYHPEEQRLHLEEVKSELETLARIMRAPDPEIDDAQKLWQTKTLGQLQEDERILAPIQLEPWHTLGPLGAPEGDPTKSFETTYGPEEGVDLARSYEQGSVNWRPTPEYLDGSTHELPDRIGTTYLYRVIDAPSARSVEVSLGSDDAIRVWLNGMEVLAKNVARGVAPDQERANLELIEGRNEVLLKIVNTGGRAGFYFQPLEEMILGMPGSVTRALLVAEPDRTEDLEMLLLEHYRENYSPEWQASAEQMNRLTEKRDQIDAKAAIVMVMDDLPEQRRRTTYTLDGGAYDRSLEPVTPDTPAFLPPMPEDMPKDRLNLARWLVSKDNPLTARVAVNRAWQIFFGRGLVHTSENFGQQGSPPSHPGLLDWLARTFTANDWNVKELHKLLVMSATYRQSSWNTRESYLEDPENVFLARGPRFRLPSWMLRDQALALSGILVEKLGGPPVKVYQPEGIWSEATFGTIRYTPDKGDALHRRSLYTFWRRIVGPTVFFDTSKRQACVVNTSRTNTPLHALTTLNETAFVEAARFFAERTIREGGDDTRTRITWAFRNATARSPSPEELDMLVARWQTALEFYSKDRAEAEALLSIGDAERDVDIDPAEHAAYTIVCSILLNMDEVLTKS